KLRPLTDDRHIGKDAFAIDPAAAGGRGSVTCPEGVTTTDRRMARDRTGRPVPLFRFPAAVCAACPQRDRCLGGPAGRPAQPATRRRANRTAAPPAGRFALPPAPPGRLAGPTGAALGPLQPH